MGAYTRNKYCYKHVQVHPSKIIRTTKVLLAEFHITQSHSQVVTNSD